MAPKAYFVAMHKKRCFFMGTLYENVILNNIATLCEAHSPKVSISKMCNDLGLSRSLITKLKANPDRTITGDTAIKIADYFGVSVDRVLGTEQKEKSPAPEGAELDFNDMQLLAAYKKADPITQEAIRRILKLQ